MIAGESKHDSRKILPKIKWKTKDEENHPSVENAQNTENLKYNTTKDKYYKPLKPNLKKKSSNYHLIKIFKLNSEDAKNDKKDLKIEDSNANFYLPLEHKKSSIELVKDKKVNIIEYEFPLLLKNQKYNLQRNHSNNKLEEDNLLDKNDVYRLKHLAKKFANKSAILNNELIANRIYNLKLPSKEDYYYKKYLFRNNEILSAYSPSTAQASLSNENGKNNNSVINFNKMQNIYINNSINSRETSLPSVLDKEKKDNEKEKENDHSIFISKLDIKSTTKERKLKMLNHKNYTKRWNLPKSFSFDKITGRQKLVRNPIKLHCIERYFEYNPNYDSILSSNKSYVKYNNDIRNNFKLFKINTTRKYVYNRCNIMNNPSNNYNIINILNEHKQEKQKKLEKRNQFKIFEDFIKYIKSKKEIV